jgi:hypothetical protein
MVITRSPTAALRWAPITQIANFFLPVNLAAQTAMPHIAPIELRPNDLASPRTPVSD